MGWIGVDLDGTLAYHDNWNVGQIGEPISLMRDRVLAWLAEGKTVKIMTARAGDPKMIREIEDWCMDHLGTKLKITDRKDRNMIELWDDRAVSVKKNSGEAFSFARGGYE